ncbi:hypothetical protein GCM10022278_38170 [Allohahella marinimesophila]|uniref:Uncharacterized protein n=1 Tax=Allohahella marinimesophila TaxID=1054972 RepID=A0ABP7Q7D7_9GAMM
MSMKVSITSGDDFHFYHEELFDPQPKSVFIELRNPASLKVDRDTYNGVVTEYVWVEMPAEVMDQIAKDWLQMRGLG